MADWQIKREGAVAVLSLDDGKANALTLKEFTGLRKALVELEKSDAGAVVLTGRAGYFTAGLNLKLMPNYSADEMSALIREFGLCVADLFVFGKPMVAAVSGHALGGGAIFAFCADVRLIAEGPFKFGLNEVPGGMFVPTFGIEVARAAIPTEFLTQCVMHGRVLSPAETKELRIVEEVLPGDQLMPRALERANQLSELAHAGYTLTKKLLRGGGAELMKKNLEAELLELGRSLKSR